MRRKILCIVMLAIALSACSQVITLKKRIGDEIKIKVSLAGAPVHRFVGCDVVYPVALMEPKLTESNKVAFLDGSVYSGRDFETLCSKATGGYVVVSRVLKSGDAVADNGLVVTLYFKCLAVGTGQITINNGDVGYVDQNGNVVKYLATSMPADFTLELPSTVTFTVTIE